MAANPSTSDPANGDVRPFTRWYASVRPHAVVGYEVLLWQGRVGEPYQVTYRHECSTLAVARQLRRHFNREGHMPIDVILAWLAFMEKCQ